MKKGAAGRGLCSWGNDQRTDEKSQWKASALLYAKLGPFECCWVMEVLSIILDTTYNNDIKILLPCRNDDNLYCNGPTSTDERVLFQR
jgi:hypothetical protein